MKSQFQFTDKSGRIGRDPFVAAARRQQGFSLVEMIGVLAIILILALAVQPSLMKQMDTVSRAQERSSLQTISDALNSYILLNHRIPGTNTIMTDVANQLGWLPGQVQTNALGGGRYFLVDPTVPNPSTGTNLSLPFTEVPGGPTNPPVNRVVLVTSMRTSIPASVLVGCTTNAVAFSNLWNAADGVSPIGWVDGSWDDIMVQRINLGPLFVQVILNSSSVTNGEYSIDGTNSHAALPKVPYSAYFLQGAVLGLHTNGGGLQSLQVLQPYAGVNRLTNNASYFFQVPSYVFDKGYWRGGLYVTASTGNTNGSGDVMQSAYDIFMSGPPRANAFGVTQSSLTWDFYNFMSNYVYYAGAANGGSFAAAKKAVVTNSFISVMSDLTYYK